MTLFIFVGQSKVIMRIVKNRSAIDSETFSYYHDISKKLITSLDKLLKRNNIDTTALNSCKMQGNTDKNSTSCKIAAAFIEGLRAET